MDRTRLAAILSLFGSTGTLVCCALPALFVTLGMGAAFGSLLSHVPGLIWFSEHKVGVFSTAGVLLAVGGVAQWQARTAPCPTDPKLRSACLSARTWSFRVYLVSLVTFLTGFGFAFLA